MKPHPEWRPPAGRPLPEQPSIQLDMCHGRQHWHPRAATLLRPDFPLAATLPTHTAFVPLDLQVLDPVTQEITRPSLLVVIDRASRLILCTFLVANAKSQDRQRAWGGEQSC